MRRLSSALGLLALVLLAGCHNLPWNNKPSPTPPPQVRGSEVPDAPTLVRVLNENAQHVQSLECRDLDILAHAEGKQIGLTGVMSCQKPRNLRLQATLFGSPAVDMGSNEQEFWYWISKAEPPYLVHCSYQDLGRGNVNLPFPFQPDWVMEALGMAEYNPQGKYQVREGRGTVELIEETTSSQGQPVRKVTVFNRSSLGTKQPMVIAHVLQDVNGKEICSAHITEAQWDKAKTFVVPYRVTLSWPSQKIKMDMKLDSPRINGLTDVARAQMFTRPQMANVKSVDLAQVQMRPTSQVQRARGQIR